MKDLEKSSSVTMKKQKDSAVWNRLPALGKKLRPVLSLPMNRNLFIPALIDSWFSERKFEQFINYPRVLEYKDFGGIRIEDNLLVTETGAGFWEIPFQKL